MAKKVFNYQPVLLILVLLIANLCWAGNSLADDAVDHSTSRGTCWWPYMELNTTYLEIRPGEIAVCEAFVELVMYSDQPISVWMWITEIPEGWNVSLNKTYFHHINNEKVNTTLSISVPINSKVGIEAEIEVGGNWSDGNWTQSFVPEQMTVRVLGPDLSVSPSDIIIPDSEYHEGQRVPIMARINNTGDVEASNISVRFLIDGKQFGRTHIIENLAPNLSWPILEDWTAVAGNHMISIEVDYEDTIDEYNETNNAASTPIYVDVKPFPWDYCAALIITLCVAALGVKRIIQGDKK